MSESNVNSQKESSALRVPGLPLRKIRRFRVVAINGTDGK